MLTALEPTPLSNSTEMEATNTTVPREVVLEASGDLPVEVVEGSGDVEGSGAVDTMMRLQDEGSGAEV